MTALVIFAIGFNITQKLQVLSLNYNIAFSVEVQSAKSRQDWVTRKSAVLKTFKLLLGHE